MKIISLALLTLALTGCGASRTAYRLILVEKQRNFYDLRTGDACEPSGYDVESFPDEEQSDKTRAELMITYKNCEVKEKVILDDKGKLMWGVPIVEKPKSKGSVGVQ